MARYAKGSSILWSEDEMEYCCAYFKSLVARDPDVLQCHVTPSRMWQFDREPTLQIWVVTQDPYQTFARLPAAFGNYATLEGAERLPDGKWTYYASVRMDRISSKMHGK